MKINKEIKLKTADDIKRIGQAGKIIAEIFSILSVTDMESRSTFEMDAYIEELIIKRKARPSFKTVKNYDYASCISLNNEVVHGIPSRKRILKKGDIVKIDIGVVKSGYFADCCYSFVIEPIDEKAKRLVNITRECLNRAINEAVPGKKIGDIGHSIQTHAEKNGYSIVRDLTGHGVGFAVHEMPMIPHYGREKTGRPLETGMVLAIEPMLNEGGPEIRALEDGWTIATADGKLSAQFEHTIAVTENGPLVLTV